jgi:hypothetical protein
VASCEQWRHASTGVIARTIVIPAKAGIQRRHPGEGRGPVSLASPLEKTLDSRFRGNDEHELNDAHELNDEHGLHNEHALNDEQELNDAHKLNDERSERPHA